MVGVVALSIAAATATLLADLEQHCPAGVQTYSPVACRQGELEECEGNHDWWLQ
jgi:hypothetical protein